MGAWRSIRAAGVRIVAGGAGSRWRARMLRTTSDHSRDRSSIRTINRFASVGQLFWVCCRDNGAAAAGNSCCAGPRAPSPGSELAPWGRVLSEQVLAWVPLPDWESSPEYRWVPSRVDEHESRATSLIEQAGLPD